jgi:hypothetical protein
MRVAYAARAVCDRPYGKGFPAEADMAAADLGVDYYECVVLSPLPRIMQEVRNQNSCHPEPNISSTRSQHPIQTDLTCYQLDQLDRLESTRNPTSSSQHPIDVITSHREPNVPSINSILNTQASAPETRVGALGILLVILQERGDRIRRGWRVVLRMLMAAVRPGGLCLSRHRVPVNSRDEGSKCVG